MPASALPASEAVIESLCSLPQDTIAYQSETEPLARMTGPRLLVHVLWESVVRVCR